MSRLRFSTWTYADNAGFIFEFYSVVILSLTFIFIFFSEDLNIVIYEYKQGANPTRIQEWEVKGFESKQKQV